MTAFLGALAGCARPAVELPPDTGALPPSARLTENDRGAPEARWDCGRLRSALRNNEDESSALEKKIQGERGRNQAAVFVAAYLPPAVLAANQQQQKKQRLDELQIQRDRLHRLIAAKACPG